MKNATTKLLPVRVHVGGLTIETSVSIMGGMKNATATKKTATKKTATKKTGRRSVPVGHDLDGILSAIARETLHIETLATRGSDSCDFHDVAVWRLKAALEAAYLSGAVLGALDVSRRAHVFHAITCLHGLSISVVDSLRGARGAA